MPKLSDVPSIPKWPSLTPGDALGEPDPYPGSISDFDDAISKYASELADARSQIQRNADAESMERRHIREYQQYIARQNRMIAECKRKGHKVPPETPGNIANAEELISEAEEILSLLPDHREAWIDERERRKDLLSALRKERAKGLAKDGTARRCGSRNTTDGSPCQNEKHYRKGSGWGPCPLQGH
ncbi:hypothetical protein [Ciceribacter selenitireducens]|uniref:Uncharacterized protein n=1 Tax=Ciceribacter selenitireducens ATCC BAA-1503 TaxID=1336235 RepID=A0A376ACD1_9HYPH|nr:hypothetical protein [Ciceribacter selenitireducens]SSC65300.1 unnamed protein product [Ciceribacter selenitireducens ATCC BAA-1503]